MRKLWTAINSLVALIFVVGAAVQWNDPDPLRWIALYLAGAAAALLGGRLPWFNIAVGVLTLSASLFVLPGSLADLAPSKMAQSMSAKTPEVEHAREFAGLVVIGTWSLLALFMARRFGRDRRPAP